MGIINNISGVLHHICVKLYPNYLPNENGAYIARTGDETLLNIEQLCAAMKDRPGFTGKHEDLIKYVNHFLDETAYQLCNGFSVNMGYYSIHPNIGGTFNSVNETHDHEKHPVKFEFRIRRPLRNLIKHITVDITGLGDSNAFIDEFTDREEKSVNSLFVPGGLFCLTGNKIKVAGDDPGCGVFFVPVDYPAGAVKVNRVAENRSSKIIGIAPDTRYVHNRIEVRTQYTGSENAFLKAPRVIASNFIIEAA